MMNNYSLSEAELNDTFSKIEKVIEIFEANNNILSEPLNSVFISLYSVVTTVSGNKAEMSPAQPKLE